MGDAAMSAFETLFGIPPEHILRQVRCVPRRGPDECWEWEHEEYDPHGALVAIYESAAPSRGVPLDQQAGAVFVKYSPWGWVLSRSDPGPGACRKPALVPPAPPRSARARLSLVT